jgi:hypothetical protein
MRYSLLIFLSALTSLLLGQTCTDCKTTYNNHTGDIKVRNNEKVCITGTFIGSIEFNGGELNICGNAQIDEVNFKQSAVFNINKGAIVRIKNMNSNKTSQITNFCDSFIIVGGNFNQPFNLVNNGKCRINGGNFNSQLDITNSDTLIWNTSLNLSQNATFNNTRFLEFNGNLNINTNKIAISSSCQLNINGDMSISGATINILSGSFKVNNVNLNSGAINLNDASIFRVNTINIGGIVEGKGMRSTMECTQNPGLNSKPSIKGEISLCVKSGNFTPNSGTIQSPASIDCENAIGSSNCNATPFKDASFRMVPNFSTEWNNSATWEMQTSSGWQPAPNGRYPTKGTSVLIGDGKVMVLTNNIEVNDLVLGETGMGTIICDSTRSIIMQVSKSLDLKGQSLIDLNSAVLVVRGQLISDLRIKGGKSTSVILYISNSNRSLIMNQSVNGRTNALDVLYYELNGGTLSLSDTLIIRKLLQPGSGTFNTNNKLILGSNNIETATIGIGVGNYITGKVKVQRYIKSIGDRRFRFASSSVTNTTVKDWQQEIFITGNNAAGTALGNTPGTLNSAGFDATLSNQPTMYYYDETVSGSLNNGWIAVTNETNTLSDVPLVSTRGYRVFIRGDRSDTNRLNGLNDFQNEVTTDLYGELNKGNIPVPVSYTSTSILANDGWNLIGNPYACPFDFASYYKSGEIVEKFDPTIWIYNPIINSYVSYNAIAGTGSLTSGIVPSGTSFWVKANKANPTFTFKEEYKVINPNADDLLAPPPLKSLLEPIIGFEKTNTSPKSATEVLNRADEISIQLIKDSINKDEMIVKFVNGAKIGADSFDIIKFWSTEVGIAQFHQESNSFFDLSSRPINYVDADFIPIYFFVNNSGNYSLNMKLTSSEIFQGGKAYLVDLFTKEQVDIEKYPLYNFSVDLNNPASVEYERFYLIFYPTKPSISEVNYFFAEPVNKKVELSFGSLSEPAPTTYFVDRGYTSSNFVQISSFLGTGGLFIPSDYEMIDSTADLDRDLFYRIRSKDTLHGITNEEVSTIIRIGQNTSGYRNLSFNDQLSVYPIPATDMITIEYKDGAYHGGLTIKVLDVMGKLWKNEKLNDPTPRGALNLYVSDLKSGLYFMDVTNLKGETTKLKFLKN